MDEEIDRELEAVLRLTKLSQSGDLKWHATEPWGELVQDEVTKYVDVYYCEYSGKRFRIYTEKNRIDKAPDITTNRLASLALFGTSQTYPYWKETKVLEITNPKGQSLWRFPYKPAIGGLFSAVKYNVAGVKEVIDSLLSNSAEANIKS